MAVVPLAEVSDLDGIAGGPFTEQAVRAAGQQIRRLAGWHIAPSVTETLTLDCPGGTHLWLPTRHVTDVAAVRDVSGDSPRALTGWRWSAAGLLQYDSGLPCGLRVVEIDLTHGYEICPDDLLPVIADRTNRRVMQESLGSRAVTYGVDGDRSIDQSLSMYKLGPRP